MATLSHRRPSSAGTFHESCLAQGRDKRDIVYEAVISSDAMASDSRITGDWRIGKDLEGCFDVVLSRSLPGKTEKNQETRLLE
jgi:hypothetical protein